MFKKNTAVPGFFIGNFINATTGAVVVTGTPVEKRTLDGTVGDCTNAASYTSGDQGWKIDLAAGDLNADLVGLSFTLTDCLPICFTIKTVTGIPDANGNTAANVTQWEGHNVHAHSEEGTPTVEVVRWGGNDVAATGINGTPKVDIAAILSHAITQTGTQVADGFQTFFDVASPPAASILTSINMASVLVNTTIAAAGRTTTALRLTAGSDQNDAYNGMMVILDSDEGNNVLVARSITDYNGADKTVTFTPAIIHDPVSGGTVLIVPSNPQINDIDVETDAIAHSVGDHGAGLTSLPAVVLANSASHGGAAAVITLATPIVANATQIEGSDATDQINAAVDVALNTAIPGSPTADSINERIAAIDTAAPLIKAVTDKVDTTLVADGAVSQFTANALELGAAGSGGDATAANQTTIIGHLTDIKGAGFTGSTDSNEAIANSVAAITPGTPINVSSQTTIITEGS
jgi:hypothetical protein